MPTLREMNEALSAKQHALAIWEMIYNTLEENFLDKGDGRKVQAIRALGCIEELVPEDKIDLVLQDIGENKINKLRQEIEELQGLEVTQGGSDR